MADPRGDYPALFRAGEFVLASGRTATWKIDCAALTPADWQGLALILKPRVLPFDRVMGVPTGGLPFADALREHETEDAYRILVVDDVWTTGGSMDRFICDTFSGWTYAPKIQRAVVFARKPPPPTVVALFTMAEHSARTEDDHV